MALAKGWSPTLNFASDLISIWMRKPEQLPQGKEREGLLRKARQQETASHVNEWLSSPGLAPPG